MSLPPPAPARTTAGEPLLPADHRHRSRRAQEVRLVNPMTGMFAPDGCPQQEGEFGIGAAVAQHFPHGLFVVGEQAVPYGAVCSQPEAVARATEGFGDTRDQADLTDAVGEAEPLGWSSGGVWQRLQRPAGGD